jgi:adenine-specific DNA-methyltransferase
MRALMDEVFSERNFIAIIPFRKKTMPFGSLFLEQMDDFILWYGKDKRATKYRQLYTEKDVRGDQDWVWFLDHNATAFRMNKEKATTHILPPGSRIYRLKSLEPSGVMQQGRFDFEYRGTTYGHPANGYGTSPEAMKRLERLDRLQPKGKLLNYRLFLEDYPVSALTIPWQDTVGADDKIYVVQTNSRVIERCILMTTDPGDLVLDPTCGSGTSASVAEHWGRRWITIDTSRVALALARARVMSTCYPFYLLADSRQGQLKEAEVTATVPSSQPVHENVRQGFVYERIPHITLSSIGSNTEIDVIWDKWQGSLETSRQSLNNALQKTWQEWEIPREIEHAWPEPARVAHEKWWEARIARQREIDASIAAKAEYEYLYDRPYEDKRTARVAGPFTVESLSPHRELGLDENDRTIDPFERAHAEKTFAEIILDNLKTAGVQQAHKADKIAFTSLIPWPGDYVRHLHRPGIRDYHPPGPNFGRARIERCRIRRSDLVRL